MDKSKMQEANIISETPRQPEKTAALVIAVPPEAIMKIIRSNNLDKTSEAVVLERFRDYAQIAADWAAKAKTIKVTSVEQITEMKMAKLGRLELREKRIAIEKTRKELGEEALRTKKAIDGVAKELTALIEPIEEELRLSEDFIKIQQEKAIDARHAVRHAEMTAIGLDPTIYDARGMSSEAYTSLMMREAERQKTEKEVAVKAEADRLAKEKADAEEREKIASENARLKADAEAKEAALQEERAASKKKLEEAETEAKKIREKEAEVQRRALAEANAKAAAQKAADEKKIAEEKTAREALEKKIATQKAAEEKAKKDAAALAAKAAAAPDKKKLIDLANALDGYTLPGVSSVSAQTIVNNVEGLLDKIVAYIQKEASAL